MFAEPKAISVTSKFCVLHIDVAESMTDLQPLVRLAPNYDPDCADETTLEPNFTFVNSGWGPVENAQVNYNFEPLSRGNSEHPFTRNIGTFLDTGKVSVLDSLRRLGVDVQRLERSNFPCESRNAIAQCLQRLIAAGTFGQLPTGSLRRASRDTNYASSAVIVADVNGAIRYFWKDAKGAVHHRRSPFTIEIPLLAFKVGITGECGAGGPLDPNHPTIALRLDAQNYRLPIRYRTTLRPGQNARINLSLKADKSSQHAFRIALRSTDSTIVQTGPIQFQYFKPRVPKETN